MEENKNRKNYLIKTTLGIVVVIIICYCYLLWYNHNCFETESSSLAKNNLKEFLCKDNIINELERNMTRNDITYKPIIYLYPEKTTEVTVKLGMPESLIVSYPKYTTDGWKVIAKPNGDLIDLKTDRNLYSLYYENYANYNYEVKEDGFIVKGKNVEKFLEEKLEILGLTEREAEEFIVFWLPKLQENKYNYIRFANIEEVNKSMPIEISREPDTIIRVMMTYKALDKPIKVKEQNLSSPKRDGFVAVEWGGTEIK